MMNNRLLRFLKEWALPLGMSMGVIGYLAFHFIKPLAPLKPFTTLVATDVIPVFLFLMLFFTFCKVHPASLRIKGWHLWLLGIQFLSCLLIALVLLAFPSMPHRILTEGAMVCLICPTAAAAAVVTGKLGGSESALTTYTILSNLLAAAVIPLFFPLIEKSVTTPLLLQFLLILRRVTPLLILPLLAAWALRFCLPRAHRWVTAHTRGAAFYLWAANLTIVIGQALRSMMNSPVSASTEGELALAGLLVCIIQFAVGKYIGHRYGDSISAGQALGQKNTVFAIWVTYTYLSPVISLAPSSYIIWQNIFNSWQLRRKQKRDKVLVCEGLKKEKE